MFSLGFLEAKSQDTISKIKANFGVEAVRRKIVIQSIEVSVKGDFGNEGEPATNITYKVHIESNASKEEIAALLDRVDQVAEIRRTLPSGVEVTLENKV